MNVADGASSFDLLLRGAVAGLLLFHLALLGLPGPRPWARAALAAFVVSLIAYLFCQRAGLMQLLPRPLAFTLLALCVGGSGWMWLATRALFDDAFVPRAWLLAVPLALTALGLAANLPRLDAVLSGRSDPPATLVGQAHGLALLTCNAATLWEVLRGWRADLVEPRRAARRWAVLGVGLYAAVSLVVELAVRGLDVGLLLPALHVASIGAFALALALWVARHSLGAILGEPAPLPAADAPVDGPAPPAPTPSPQRARLETAMAEQALYRQEGLSLAALAQALDIGEAPLRRLINQELGYRNFNDFLHHHRLQEAAARLPAEELPILSTRWNAATARSGPSTAPSASASA